MRSRRSCRSLPRRRAEIDWSKPLAEWPRETMVEFLTVALPLIRKAMIARDLSDSGITRKSSAAVIARQANAAAGGPLTHTGRARRRDQHHLRRDFVSCSTSTAPTYRSSHQRRPQRGDRARRRDHSRATASLSRRQLGRRTNACAKFNTIGGASRCLPPVRAKSSPAGTSFRSARSPAACRRRLQVRAAGSAGVHRRQRAAARPRRRHHHRRPAAAGRLPDLSVSLGSKGRSTPRTGARSSATDSRRHFRNTPHRSRSTKRIST